MKRAILLTLLSIYSICNTVNATGEDTSVTDDFAAFCTEQADLAGIEDQDEKQQFVQDCMLSYGVQSDDPQQ